MQISVLFHQFFFSRRRFFFPRVASHKLGRRSNGGFGKEEERDRQGGRVERDRDRQGGRVETMRLFKAYRNLAVQNLTIDPEVRRAAYPWGENHCAAPYPDI